MDRDVISNRARDIVADMDPVTLILLRRGLAPHTKPVSLAPQVESWWEFPGRPGLSWPTVALLVAFMVFILILVHAVTI